MGCSLLIQIAPQFRILVAIEAIDGRKGIDALARLCRGKLVAAGGLQSQLSRIRWHGRRMTVPLFPLTAVEPDESTADAIGDAAQRSRLTQRDSNSVNPGNKNGILIAPPS